MKKKLHKLSFFSFILAIIILAISFFFFHYVTADLTIASEFQKEAGKPFVTLLIAIWGVMFLFSSVISLIIARIFFPDKDK